MKHADSVDSKLFIEQVHIGRFINLLMRLDLIPGADAIKLYLLLEKHFLNPEVSDE